MKKKMESLLLNVQSYSSMQMEPLELHILQSLFLLAEKKPKTIIIEKKIQFFCKICEIFSRLLILIITAI